MKEILSLMFLINLWLGLGIIVLYRYANRYSVESMFQAITIVIIWPIILISLHLRK